MSGLLFFAGAAFAGDTTGAAEPIQLTTQMMVVMGVLIFAIALFVFEWVRIDVVGIIMMILLPILGLVTPREAISGLSSNAVVSIIAVIIIGAGLDKTGCMNVLARNILRFAGKAESRIIALISGTVAVISSFMQNIGAAALFMPAAIRVSRQVNVPVSRILMPMGFCAIVGGTITLVGASPTILLNDLLDQANRLGVFETKMEAFGLFTQTPIGIALVTSAILYFIIFGKFILPKKSGTGDAALVPPHIADTYVEICGGLHELHIPEGYSDNRTLDELKIRPNYQVTVVAVSHTKTNHKVFAPTRDEQLYANDDIAVVGCPEAIEKFASDFGFVLRDDLEVFAEDLSPNNAGMIEGIITPRSELSGKTMREVRFRKTFEVNPVIMSRRGECILGALSDKELHPGDALLLFGRWEKFHTLKDKQTFVFTTDIKGEIMKTEKAKIALSWLIVAIGLVLGFNPIMAAFGYPDFKLSLSVCLLTGALGMILTKVLSIDEAYKSVDWMTVFLLAGLIPLGLAFQKTGTAEYIATSIMNMIGSVPVIAFLAVVGIMTSFFTLVVSNVGATVLLVPLAMTMAIKAGADPRLTALVVALSASNTFILPTHQVNALVMRPGGYKTVDYTKAGAGMTILFLIIMLSMLYLFY
ncbi:MAG: SLC13 family permease [Nitrospiraceae bacterium]|nr:MAG: SLC13 family permease [Nitrospiraceae bacterium]